MAQVTIWSNVKVEMQSALAAAVNITGISKASPAVVTYTGSALSDGDYVQIFANGMTQVDGRVFRITSPSSGEFSLEGVDSTDFDTFSSGTFEKITFGTTMATATGLQASGGDFEFIDTTTIHDNIRKQVPGLASPAVYTFENFWDPSDPALIAMKQASDTQSMRAIRFTFASGAKVAFLGYVGATLLPVGNAQDKVTTSVAVTMFGRPTVYAS